MLPKHTLYGDLPTVQRALEDAGAAAALTKQFAFVEIDLHL